MKTTPEDIQAAPAYLRDGKFHPVQYFFRKEVCEVCGRPVAYFSNIGRVSHLKKHVREGFMAHKPSKGYRGSNASYKLL